ncbi:MAG: glycine zipper 2TM domain-containing protein [Paludibacter sp.]|nr:glycine zipper 2TM domain-containing protein [Paludibacter sp.]
MKIATLLLVLATLLSVSLSADGFSSVEYVNVTHSDPIYSTVNDEVYTEQCRDVREAVSDGNSGSNDVIGAVVGGALGGVLGHNVGGGTGKTVATVGGAVLGTLAGKNIGSKYNTSDNGSYQIVRKCERVPTTQSHREITGYMSTGTFRGETIRVQSRETLKQIPVTVTYSY